jgi:hypothetical protein
VEREWILIVGDAAAMETYRAQRFPEYPGRKIRDLTAYKLSGDDLIEADVRTRGGEALEGCSTGHSYRIHDVDFGALARGDVLGLRIRYELVGQNPSYVHPIEGPIPVLQSDVTFEVPRELMEGSGSGRNPRLGGSGGACVMYRCWERVTPRAWSRRHGSTTRSAHAEVSSRPPTALGAWERPRTSAPR